VTFAGVHLVLIFHLGWGGGVRGAFGDPIELVTDLFSQSPGVIQQRRTKAIKRRLTPHIQPPKRDPDQPQQMCDEVVSADVRTGSRESVGEVG
jgi:hypothetical protein